MDEHRNNRDDMREGQFRLVLVSAVHMFLFIVVSQCHSNSSKMEVSSDTTIPHEHMSK